MRVGRLVERRHERMNVKHQWIAKLALMAVWPPLALLLAALIALVLVMSWFLIPFGVIKRKD